MVEDDAMLRRRLRDDLARRGYAVDVADNGIDAEHAATEIAHDAVVLDLGLPGRAGLDVLEAWRARGNVVAALVPEHHGPRCLPSRVGSAEHALSARCPRTGGCRVAWPIATSPSPGSRGAVASSLSQSASRSRA